MDSLKKMIICSICLLITFALGCTNKSVVPVELKHYPVDSMDGIISKTGVRLDKEISSDGNGSLKVSADKPTSVKLYETGDIHVEDARLIYQANVRTEKVDGQVFIEMWCHFSDKGEFFSRSIQTPLSGDNDWISMETPFFLKKGQNPDNVKINVVINGKGTVWVDDIRLLKAPL